MPIQQQNIFFNSSGLDSDTADRFKSPGNSDFILNDIMSFVSGKAGARVNVKGTEQVHDAGTGITYIGAVEDIEREAIIWFLRHSDGNGSIIRIALSDDSITNIFTNQDFRFAEDLFISHANIVGDLLYWVEGENRNEPRQFNINSAIAFTNGTGGYTEFNQEIISAAKSPPSNRPLFDPLLLSDHLDIETNPASTNVTIQANETVKMVLGVRSILQNNGSTNLIGSVQTNMTFIIEEAGGSQVFSTAVTVTTENLSSNFYDVTKQASAEHTITSTGTYDIRVEIQNIVRRPDNTIIFPSVSTNKYRFIMSGINSISAGGGYMTDDSVLSNNLKDKQFQFAYRYIYDNNEKSNFSSFSDVLIPSESEGITGENNSVESENAVIQFMIGSGPSIVRKIEIAVKIGELGAWNSYDIIDKIDMYIPNNTLYPYRFYNDKAKTPIDNNIIKQTSTTVPLSAGVQEFLPTNELCYGRVKEGFFNIATNIELTQINTNYTYATNIDPVPVEQMILTRTDSGRNYEVRLLKFSIGNTIDTNKVLVLNAIKDQRVIQVSGIFDPSGLLPWDNPSYIVNTRRIGQLLDQIRLQLIEENAADDGITQETAVGYNWSRIAASSDPFLNILAFPTSAFDESVSFGSNVNPGDTFIEWYLPLSMTRTDAGNRETREYFSFASMGVYDIENVNISPKLRTFDHGLRAIGIKYSDERGRSSTVQTTEDSRIYLNRNATGITQANSIIDIEYRIKHKPPMWATKYQMVISKNLSITNSLQWTVDSLTTIREAGITYLLLGINNSIIGTREISSRFRVGTYVFTEGDQLFRIGRQDTDGTWIKIDDDRSYDILGLEGDVARTRTEYAYANNQFQSLQVDVVDPDGNTIFTDRSQKIKIRVNESDYPGMDLESLFGVGTIIEVVTPVREQREDFYFEVGDEYNILNPGTISAAHQGQTQDQSGTSPISTPAIGIIKGDKVWKLRRNLFAVTSFPSISSNVSDFYDSTNGGFGKVNLFNGEAEQRVYNIIRHSGKYFDNTNINDLNRFVQGSTPNYVPLDDKFGPITRIIQVGDALKVYQTRKPTSIYIGKSFIKQGDGTDQVMTVDRTFGVVNPSELDYGCQFPESVLRNERYVYYYDIYSEAFLRDAPNGIEPVSNYKMRGYFKNKSRALLASGIENVKVITGYDNENDLVYVTFIDSVTPANNETLAFHEEGNRWKCFFSFIPDMYARLGSKTYGAKGQTLHLFNSETAERGNFFGIKYSRQFKIYTSVNPNMAKVFFSMAIHTNKNVWECPEIEIQPTDTYPRGMFSRLKNGKFVFEEGIGYADFMRNMLTTSTSQSVEDLVNGDQLRGEVMSILLSENSTEEVVLYEVDINFSM